MLKEIKENIMLIECPRCSKDYTFDLTNFPWHTLNRGSHMELSNIMTFCEHCDAVTGYNMNIEEDEVLPPWVSEEERLERRLLIKLRGEIENA